MKKVSIIIPAYNEEKYIGQTIEAVQKIDYPDFEIIVVDNNSKDKTSEVARRYPGVKVLFEPNKGTQWTRECGRKAATGEIIGNVDADCIPHKDWLKVGVKYFDDPEVVTVTGPYNYYDSSPLFRWITLVFQRFIYKMTNFFCRLTGKGGVLVGGNCLLRHDTLKKIGGYNTAILFYGDDTDTVKRMTKYGKAIFSNELIIDSSARRFKNDGIMHVLWNYFYYFIKTIILPREEHIKNKIIQADIDEKTRMATETIPVTSLNEPEA
jgi:cellulose synthase/poly-beta-1,6-N-acetylglucosamine synthase-like glycosyltransferase